MYSTIELLIGLASGLLSTTYGWGELSCGAKPARPCIYGEATASGEVLDPWRVPSAAIAAPRGLVMEPRWIWIRLADGPWPCMRVRLNDKSHPRWLGNRGFDLSPAAVRKLIHRRPTAAWSGRVIVCQP